MKDKIEECSQCRFITKTNNYKRIGGTGMDLCDICAHTFLGNLEGYGRITELQYLHTIAQSLGYIANVLFEYIGRDKINEILKKQSELEGQR